MYPKKIHKFAVALFTSLSFLLSCSKPVQVEKEADHPPFPLKLMESRVQSISPEADPGDWLLAHIDVETTGLLPGYHEMIDIGLVLTDLNGNIIDSLFLRTQPKFPERISPIAKQINAFDAEKWKQLGALSNEATVDSLLRFHKRAAPDRPILMVAFNAHFDSAFLDHLFRGTGHSWRELYHYFILDIPSMAWSLGYQDLTLDRFIEEHQIQDEPHVAEKHTGITGAMVNVRIYKALMNK